jgi:hypothetical protein
MNRVKAIVSSLFAVVACVIAVSLWFYKKAEPVERYLKADKEHQ